MRLAHLAFCAVSAWTLVLLTSFAAAAQVPSIVWPGQPGNPVGYAAIGPLNDSAACPAYSSGTAGNPVFISNCYYSSCPTVSQSHIVFMSVDWDCGIGGLTASGTDITFYGSRIQSNSVQNANGANHSTGTYIYYIYTSWVPRVALAGTAPPGLHWPASGAGVNNIGGAGQSNCTVGTNCISGNDGFETGLQITAGGPVWMDHVDTWGDGAGPDFTETSNAQMTLTESWIHNDVDQAQGWHRDGIACYVNSGAAPNNLLGMGNTVASIADTNGLACQQASSGYNNLQFNENYFSGYGFTISWCTPSAPACTNSGFWGNVLGTDVTEVWGPSHGGAAIDSTSFWGCNRLQFASGTSWTTGNGWRPTSSENGHFILPSSTSSTSATDYNGNTVCAQTDPVALDFKTQGKNTTSSGQTITLTNTGSSSLSVGPIAPAAGSQFAISSNACGTSLAAGASCEITVTFTPTTLGPQTDTLNITNGMHSPANVIPVPLIGLGIAGSVSIPPQVQGVGTQVR